MSEYSEWLGRKLLSSPSTGFEPSELSRHLFPFQHDLVRWALRRGRGALFADTGLGKTLMQLEWAWRVHVRTGAPVLILTPLAVAAQTVDEARRFGIEATLCRGVVDWSPGINITNYERLHRFDDVLGSIGAVVLDESSCLKDFTSKTRTDLIERFRSVPFRLACTATPSPNDHTELGNHAEFLGVMTRSEMLASYFINAGDKANQWRLKKHATKDFWRWVCSWAALVRKPSDLGYDDGAFELPPLITRDVALAATNEAAKQQGRLFVEPASTLSEQRVARRSTLSERCAAVADLVATEPGEPWLVWCELNDESSALAKLIPGSVEVCGSDSVEHKEAAALWFAEGGKWKTNRLATITGPGDTEAIQSSDNERSTSPRQGSSESGKTRKAHTCTSTTSPTETSTRETESSKTWSTSDAEHDTVATKTSERSAERRRATEARRASETLGSRQNTESTQPSTTQSLSDRGADAQSAARTDQRTSPPERLTGTDGCTSTTTTTTKQELSADCCAHRAILDSESSETTRSDLSEPRHTCGIQRDVLISKPTIFGQGLNFQRCARMVFVGLSHSFEQYYQAVRRCWRFGQTREVRVYIVAHELEGSVVENVRRKHADAERMGAELSRLAGEFVRAAVIGAVRTHDGYAAHEEIVIPGWLS